MTESFLTILAVVLLIWGGFAFLIARQKKERRAACERKIKDSWGSSDPRLFLPGALERIHRLSDEEGAELIDAQTAADLDLDAVFARICRCFSSAGEEVLYSWLRHPAMDRAAFEKRDRLISWFGEHEAERAKALAVLSELSFVGDDSFYGHLTSLWRAKPVGNRRFIAAAAVTAAALVLLFMRPLPGVLFLSAALYADYRLHIGMKEQTAGALKGLKVILLLADAAEGLLKIEAPYFHELRDEVPKILNRLKRFRAASFFLTAKGGEGTGLFDAVLEYVNLFFHPDLIYYDSLLRMVRDHRQDTLVLLRFCGSADAAISAASYRESLSGGFCRPEFTEEILFVAEGLYHPLLKAPVENDISTDMPLMITGSNASGKSTFIKASALAVLLGQGIATVSAAHCRMPFFRVMTSIAARDDLEGGDSYYMAEIKSVLRIFDAADADGAPVFAFIDEILKGTNTVERIAASAEILKHLALSGKLLVFAATHDRELTSLLEAHYRNMHFTEEIEGQDVRFDYRIREGAARSRNAILLLDRIGYDRALTEKAQKMAEEFEQKGSWTLV